LPIIITTATAAAVVIMKYRQLQQNTLLRKMSNYKEERGQFSSRFGPQCAMKKFMK
jgi:hypothetical protein